MLNMYPQLMEAYTGLLTKAKGSSYKVATLKSGTHVEERLLPSILIWCYPL